MSNISIERISVTALNVGAVVNAANSRLEKGGGVCGAIFREAGSKELAAACRAIGGCKTGEAVITPGFMLKAPYIIHAVGPIWNGGMNGEPTQLYNAYRSSLELARKHNIHSIGFPLISAGIYGYPLEDAWRKALRACLTFIEENQDYEIDIIFAVLDQDILKLGQEILDITLYASEVELGKKPALVSPKLFPIAKDFYNRNLNLLKAIARDETISSWFKAYDVYEQQDGFEGLRGVLDREVFRRAYDEGLIIRKYQDIIDESKLDAALVAEPTDEWLETLTQEQIIACVAFHYRRDHFNEGSFYKYSVGEGWLLKYFERFLNME